jgi:hypothetical protein
MAQSAMFSAMGAMPAKLLRKEVLVSEGNERLRVVTLTFANPNGKSLGLKPHTHIQTQTYYHDVCKHPYNYVHVSVFSYWPMVLFFFAFSG